MLGCLAIAFIATDSVYWPQLALDLSLAKTIMLTFGWSALTAPFNAHVLTVVYYRLADPDKPIVHPDVRSWQSVWAGR